MERLTRKSESKYVNCNIDDECTGMCGSCERNSEIRRKLRAYEDAEEQGLLIRLPCPIGTTVYDIRWWDEKEESVVVDGNRFFRRIQKHKISKSSFGYHDIKDFGKIVFLTKAEAEAALKKMKEGQNE